MSTYIVRNWNKFQHYKDRNPPWIKLHFELLSSADWVTLDDASRVLAVACMLVASRNGGHIDGSARGLMYLQRVAYLNSAPNLKPLIECGFLECASAMLADASALQADARPETETEAEAETEAEEAPTEPVASATDDPPKLNGYDRELEASIVAAYHEILPNLPRVRDWNDRRKRKLRDRIRERVKDGKPADKVDYWIRVFRKAADSDFLMGRKTDWRCPGLEWLLEPKNFTKLIEGAYDNHGRS